MVENSVEGRLNSETWNITDHTCLVQMLRLLTRKVMMASASITENRSTVRASL